MLSSEFVGNEHDRSGLAVFRYGKEEAVFKLPDVWTFLKLDALIEEAVEAARAEAQQSTIAKIRQLLDSYGR